MTDSKSQTAIHSEDERESIHPEGLIEREDVPLATRTSTHEAADFCEADTQGRVIVGVTRQDGGVILQRHPESDHAILPNCTVDADDSWPRVARDTASRVATVPVTLDEPLRVRRVEHYLEGEEDPHTVAHHVLVSASLARDNGATVEPSVDDDTPWTAGWYHEVPTTGRDDPGDPIADIDAVLG